MWGGGGPRGMNLSKIIFSISFGCVKWRKYASTIAVTLFYLIIALDRTLVVLESLL